MMTWNNINDLAETFGLSDQEKTLLAQFDEHFVATAGHTNLVARNSLPDRWSRHYADSLQLFEHIPEQAASLLDVGSGAGFPGLLIGILATERRPELRVLLCDSVGKKASFLTEMIVALGLENTTVTSERAETFHVKHHRFDVITARAVTALDGLLGLTAPLLAEGGRMICPKGARAMEEIAQAQDKWRFKFDRIGSMTHPDASILLVSEPEQKP